MRADHRSGAGQAQPSRHLTPQHPPQVLDFKPGLYFNHFGDPDVKSREFGMISQKMQAFADSDVAFKVIRDAVGAAVIERSSVCILTADHGGQDIKDSKGRIRGTHGSSGTVDVTIPWVAWGSQMKSGVTTTATMVQYHTSATALWLLGLPVPEGFPGPTGHHLFHAVNA